MAVEAHKVIRRPSEPSGAQEMSASIARAVDSILDILRNVPPAYRLQVLRIAESKIRPSILEGSELVRKVSRSGRSYVVILPLAYAHLEGTYKLTRIERSLIYERNENGEIKVRVASSARNLRLPLPKWAYEAIGSPAYVRVRVEGSRIVVEPA